MSRDLADRYFVAAFPSSLGSYSTLATLPRPAPHWLPPVKITRLARGIASGSVLEFANKQMLYDALQGRHTF